MAEVVTGTGDATNVTREYECYAGTFRRSTSLLVDAAGMPYETAVFIHAVAVDDAQLVEAAGVGARAVWSPSSNISSTGRPRTSGACSSSGCASASGRTGPCREA